MILKRLVLEGFRKNYEIIFKSGLNVISGPTSTGKTTIMEMIDYCFGAEKHKYYLEIKNSCSKVSLEFSIDNESYLIKRTLFDFKKPAEIYSMTENNSYVFLKLAEIDSPQNQDSLSYFMMSSLGLSGISIYNQCFSFRDLFKYSYLKQIQIDDENILKEKDSGHSIKRKPTFEIIFSFYDEFLNNLRSSLKQCIKDIDKCNVELTAVKDFLEKANLSTERNIEYEIEEINALIKEKNSFLKSIKSDITSKDSYISKDVVHIKTLKDKYNKLLELDEEKESYIMKLQMLIQQYNLEIKELMINAEGIKYTDSVALKCPICHQDVKKNDVNHCMLCGQFIDDKATVLVEYSERAKVIKTKCNELVKYLEKQIKESSNIKKEVALKKKELLEQENKMDGLYNEYITPYLSEIEKINKELGQLNSQFGQIKSFEKMKESYNSFELLKNKKELEKDKLNTQISNLVSEMPAKDEVFETINKMFNIILKGFKFPKLDAAQIDDKNYLPYVRGIKYNELGSSGAVSLITIAYYLTVLKASLSFKNNNHLNLLMIDSPRKNLGANAKDPLFSDEVIFRAVASTIITMSKESQIIVINNGDISDFLKENVIIEFDPTQKNNLKRGLIDDI